MPQAGRPPGRRAALTLLKHFYIYIKKKKRKKKRNKLETRKQNKNQGNILVLLHFNQAIVLLWCSHYGIKDGPEHAQTGGENLKQFRCSRALFQSLAIYLLGH